MSFPWWKTVSTPSPGAPEAPWTAGTQGPAPSEFGVTTMRCSAEGCTFQGSDFVTAALGPGVRPYCQHHATGGELKIRDLLWKLPCACGKVADGFHQVVGGYSAVHSERKCIVRTIQAAPDDATVPMDLGMLSAGQARVAREQGCACGKRVDGTVSSADGFTEWHSVRECIEQTLKAQVDDSEAVRAARPARSMMSADPADALLLVGASTIEDLLSLVRERLPAARLQVLSLAAALARAAAEGEVPESYVADALKATRKMAGARESKPH
jgi:hypothetical protein